MVIASATTLDIFIRSTFTVTVTIFVELSEKVIVISFIISPSLSGVNVSAFVVAPVGKFLIPASKSVWVTSWFTVAFTSTKFASNESASVGVAVIAIMKFCV